VDQITRTLTPDIEADMIDGAYWLRKPGPNPDCVIIAMGAVMTEAIDAVGQLADKRRDVGLLAVTSADRLNAGWTAATRARAQGYAAPASAIERHLAELSPHTRFITVLDGHPATLSWIGGVRGHNVVSLGVEHFGQSGSIRDLYRHFEIDSRAILEAVQSVTAGQRII
jgi:pyruvate dehydrogenase E1 component